MPAIRMPRRTRGCGQRKKGGLYLFFDMQHVVSCPNMPLPLPESCPVCGEEIQQFRSMKMINPMRFFKPVAVPCSILCPACTPPPKGALMWVGKTFYSVESFVREALSIGISKRIRGIPKGLQMGDPVYFLHSEAIPATNEEKAKPGVFLVARLSAVHKIIDETQEKDSDLMNDLEKQGITPVIEYDTPIQPGTPTPETTQICTVEQKESVK